MSKVSPHGVAPARSKPTNPRPSAADDDPYQVTPSAAASAAHVRDWIRGYGILPGDDKQLYVSEAPPSEVEEIMGVLWPTRQPWQLRLMRQRDQQEEETE